MISRRDLLLSSAALAVTPRARRVTNDLRVRECLVRLKDADVRVLTGIPARELTVGDAGSTRLSSMSRWDGGPVLRIGVAGQGGSLELADTPPCRLEFMNGGEGFVTAWAYPVSFHGYMGYQPSLDLPPLLQHGDGEFWRLPFDKMPTPPSVREARGLHVTFLTTTEVTLQQINDRILQLQERVPAETDLIVTSYVEPHFEPTVLLSLFGTRA